MAYYIMFLWIPGRDGTRSKVTGNVLVNALHAFHRFNRRYYVKNDSGETKDYSRIKIRAKTLKRERNDENENILYFMIA